jgi:ribosomal protein S18 acetylase RimI-like enzyme
VKVRRATHADTEVAGLILDEATAYVTTLGYDQWPVPFPPDELAQRIERGELYLVEVDGEPAATVTLLWDDPFFWGAQPPDAAYVHKLAIRRVFAGRGLGEAIVEWADRQAAAAGRRYLRLDCMRDNDRIRSYYERLGFEHRGDRDHPRFAAALYERRIRPK